MNKNNIVKVAIMTAAALYFAGGVAGIRTQSPTAPDAPAVFTVAVTENAPAATENASASLILEQA